MPSGLVSETDAKILTNWLGEKKLSEKSRTKDREKAAHNTGSFFTIIANALAAHLHYERSDQPL